MPEPAPVPDWDWLSERYEALAALDPSERRRALAALAAHDAPGHAALADLLQAHAVISLDDLGTELRAMVLPAALDEGAAGDPAPPVLAHYAVHEALGRGGMGIVYRATDLRLQRPVALKVLTRELSDDRSRRERLLREARALSQVDHENVCAVHGVEEDAAGRLCLVMAYCDAGTVRDRLQGDGIAPAAVLPVLHGIAAGLASAHRRGVVHGDITPANIGLMRDGRPRILDFGLAEFARADDTSAVGHRRGTRGYLAPELLRGAPPTPRSDVFAFGMVMLDVLRSARATPPTAASADAAQADRTFRALTALARSLTDPDPAARPPDAGAVGALLAALGDRAGEPARRRLRVGVALAVVGVVATSGVLLTRARAQATSVRAPATLAAPAPAPVSTGAVVPRVAVLPFVVSGPDSIAYLARGLPDILTVALDATGALSGLDPSAVASRAPAHDALPAVAGADRIVRGTVLGTGRSVTLTARMLRPDGSTVSQAVVVVPALDSLPDAIARLAHDLLAGSFDAPRDADARSAAIGTRSTPALRAYLAGEAAMRDARPAIAIEAFREAVRVDSSFALGWYRLARAAQWWADDSLVDRALARVRTLATGQPDRAAMLFRAAAELRFGSPRSAEAMLRARVRSHPSDLDAWLLLGELRLHDGPAAGLPRDSVRAAFEAVMALDPTNRMVTVPLMALAVRDGRLGALDTLFTMYFRPNSAGEQPGIHQAYRGLYVRRQAGGRATVPPTDDAEGTRIALAQSTADIRDRAALDRYARTLLNDRDATRADSVLALRALVSLAAVAGDRAAAEARWSLLDAVDGARSVALRAIVLTAPNARLGDSAALADALRALRAAPRASSSPDPDLTAAEDRALRLHAELLVAARLRDTAAVTAAAGALDRLARDAGAAARRLVLPLARAAQAHRSVALGDLRGARRWLDGATTDVPPRVRARHPLLEHYGERWLQLSLATALGDTTTAARWRASLADGPAELAMLFWPGAVSQPAGAPRRARISTR